MFSYKIGILTIKLSPSLANVTKKGPHGANDPAADTLDEGLEPSSRRTPLHQHDGDHPSEAGENLQIHSKQCPSIPIYLV